MGLSAEEAIAILEDIDSGADRLVAVGDWSDYAADIEYVSAAGHRVVFFNDCGYDWRSFDYVDSVHHADGRNYECEAFEGDSPGNWRPTNWAAWGIPEPRTVTPPDRAGTTKEDPPR